MAKIESKPRGVDRGAGTATGRDLRDLPRQDLAQTNFTGLVARTRPDLERIQQTANFAGEVLNDVEELRAENRVTDIEAEFDKDYAIKKKFFNSCKQSRPSNINKNEKPNRKRFRRSLY